AQQLASLFQPALERGYRHAQETGRLVARSAFQAAQDQGRAIILRQSIQLFVEDILKIPSSYLRQNVGRRLGPDTALLGVSSPCRSPRRQRQVIGDPVKP